MVKRLGLVLIAVLFAAGCQVVKFPAGIGDFVTDGEGTTYAVPGNGDGKVGFFENLNAKNGMTLAQVEYVIGQKLTLYSYPINGYAIYEYNYESGSCFQYLDYRFKDGKLYDRYWKEANC